jgi:hypothetical protein
MTVLIVELSIPFGSIPPLLSICCPNILSGNLLRDTLYVRPLMRHTEFETHIETYIPYNYVFVEFTS